MTDVLLTHEIGTEHTVKVEAGNGRRCDRCHRALKRAYPIPGVGTFGPICVGRMGFTAVQAERKPRKVKVDEPEVNPNQLGFNLEVQS